MTFSLADMLLNRAVKSAYSIEISGESMKK